MRRTIGGARSGRGVLGRTGLRRTRLRRCGRGGGLVDLDVLARHALRRSVLRYGVLRCVIPLGHGVLRDGTLLRRGILRDRSRRLSLAGSGVRGAADD
ncbi:hypothetical protein [Streptomyces deccanensis]|uniref:hypothetical protein n=1 Tax=Streptomyces deccanensis TaxID=424188 RepID=UPI001EFB2AD7|nr:hypothetical protein L3078_32990 [Streptomyces deccanensis]